MTDPVSEVLLIRRAPVGVLVLWLGDWRVFLDIQHTEIDATSMGSMHREYVRGPDHLWWRGPLPEGLIRMWPPSPYPYEIRREELLAITLKVLADEDRGRFLQDIIDALRLHPSPWRR